MKIFIPIMIALIALFAWQADKAKWQRVYLEGKLEYCQKLVVAYWTNDQNEINRAEKLYFYGCTRQK